MLSKTKHSRKTANREHTFGISSHTQRSFLKPIKNMASSLIVLLSLVLAVAIAVPIPQDDAETTTAANVQPLYAVVEVIEDIPVLVPLVEAPEVTTEAETKETVHKVARRSLRGDNPSNDILEGIEEGQQDDNGLSSLAGRRIKFLPTWLG